jgi:CO/xanthine dehydrogenase Mo-binding subunit
MSRNVKLKIGIQDNLEEISLEIPEDKPRPWDGSDKLKMIGGRVARIDGLEKTTGKAKYTFDMQLPGMLYGRFIRSPHPAAIIKNIDISQAQKYPGVKAIINTQDNLPITVRFAGQEILAIAAETQQQANEAAKLVKIEYDLKPYVLNAEDAQKENAPLVFQKTVEEKKTEGDLDDGEDKVKQRGNVRGPNQSLKGGTKEEIEAALKASDVTVERTYRTQVQTHSAMETHGVVAQWEDDQHLTVWASTQGTFSVRNEMADVFNLPRTNVRVITNHMGGGFGAKFGAGNYGVMAAKLAQKTKKPVRLMLDRKEEHLAVGNRPNSVQNLQVAANKNGIINAIKLVAYGTAGTGTGAGCAGPAKNVYNAKYILTEESDVFINAGPGAAFRAPGHPQGAFALEQAVDELAYKLNIDPLEFRKKNTQHHPVRQVELDMAGKRFGWDKRNPLPGASKGPVKRGIGIANSVWYYFYGKGYRFTVQVNSDGSVELLNGVQDIGSGIRTVLAMVVAEELGLKHTDISVRIGDTQLGYAPGSGGSVTTGATTPAARDAAYLAKLKMFEIAAPLLNTNASKLSAQDGKIFVTGDPLKSLSWKQVASKMSGDNFSVASERVADYREIKDRNMSELTTGGVQIAEVEVDTETGVVKVLRVTAVHDCGRPMDRLTLESQINGGIIQGVSYALFEDRILDRNTGNMVNANLEQYKIAGSMDIPEIDAVALDVNHSQNSTGAIGIGEPATVATSGAIANAIFHAIGARVYELPMTPARVLSALSKKEGGLS